MNSLVACPNNSVVAPVKPLRITSRCSSLVRLIFSTTYTIVAQQNYRRKHQFEAREIININLLFCLLNSFLSEHSTVRLLHAFLSVQGSVYSLSDQHKRLKRHQLPPGCTRYFMCGHSEGWNDCEVSTQCRSVSSS